MLREDVQVRHFLYACSQQPTTSSFSLVLRVATGGWLAQIQSVEPFHGFSLWQVSGLLDRILFLTEPWDEAGFQAVEGDEILFEENPEESHLKNPSTVVCLVLCGVCCLFHGEAQCARAPWMCAAPFDCLNTTGQVETLKVRRPDVTASNAEHGIWPSYHGIIWNHWYGFGNWLRMKIIQAPRMIET